MQKLKHSFGTDFKTFYELLADMVDLYHSEGYIDDKAVEWLLFYLADFPFSFSFTPFNLDLHTDCYFNEKNRSFSNEKNDFRTVFDPPKVLGFHFNKPSMTQQSFSYETDINNIVKGCISSLPASTDLPRFGETFKPTAYDEAMNVIITAKSQFEQLPSHIRKRFDNDPQKLLSFLDDKNNLDEAISLGLVKDTKMTSVSSENVVQDVQPVSGATSEASAQSHT